MCEDQSWEDYLVESEVRRVLLARLAYDIRWVLAQGKNITNILLELVRQGQYDQAQQLLNLTRRDEHG